jgi:hypothetical protein
MHPAIYTKNDFAHFFAILCKAGEILAAVFCSSLYFATNNNFFFHAGIRW